jgi:hypothetical protein
MQYMPSAPEYRSRELSDEVENGRLLRFVCLSWDSSG